MKEEFLHYLWKYRLLKAPLVTTNGEAVEVIKTGIHNTDAGPDFIDSRLRIDGTLWVGNIEIHLQSSSWYEHKHDGNKAYNNVILHLVLNNDKPARRSDGQIIPCIECNDRIPELLHDKYTDLMSSRLWVPCARIIKFCPEIVVSSWIETLLVERLTQKAEALEMILKSVGNDWEEAFYRLLAGSFGSKINTTPFEMLAASLPHKILTRHHNQALQTDALLFGQAGFLEEEIRGSYPESLKQEYDFLRNKYSLKPMDAAVWKFLRLRPAAFPTIRLAQFSSLMQKSPALFARVLEAGDIGAIKSLFRVDINKYWQNHYRFGKKSSGNKQKSPGGNTIDLLLINAVVPMLFLYGKQLQYEELRNRALSFLEKLPPENNSIVRRWKSLGVAVHDAFASQALLHLKHHYCDPKKCLNCRIGNELLK
jgi:hypothetical protein